MKCIEMIKKFEGFSPVPYKCAAGVLTIGFGSTRYENGVHVAETDLPIDEARAVHIMQETLKSYERDVTRYVKAPINQHQFDALVDFAYNVGSKNLLTSTLLKKLNNLDYRGACMEFEKWQFANGKKLKGLLNRRLAEKQLFASI